MLEIADSGVEMFLVAIVIVRLSILFGNFSLESSSMPSVKTSRKSRSAPSHLRRSTESPDPQSEGRRHARKAPPRRADRHLHQSRISLTTQLVFKS